MRLYDRIENADLRRRAVATQRGRLLVAMADVVGEKGYAATAVADVLKAAGMSRKTFYEQFRDKEECFLAAYDLGVEILGAELARTIAGRSGWRDQARAALEAWLNAMAGEPGFARAFTIEVWAAGPEAAQRHMAQLDAFVALLRSLHEAARADDPSIVAVDDTQLAAVAGGIDRIAQRAVVTGRTSELPERADELFRFALSVIAKREDP